MGRIVLAESPVRFNSTEHRYWLGDKELQGITKTLVHRAYPDTYKCPTYLTEEEWQKTLQEAAEKGSNMHETIELHDELGITSDMPELKSYIRIKKENGLEVLASEYIVSDEEHYATAVDKVMQRPDGSIILVDFKRTSTLHIENVTVQQSICKRFFEKQNPNLKVSAIYVMWLRGSESKFVELTPWADETLDLLIESDLKDEAFDVTTTYGSLPAKVYDIQSYLYNLEAEVKEKSEELKRIKDGLCQMMLERNIKKFTTSVLQMTTVAPKPKTTFDSKNFALEHPDLYSQYLKESEVKPSVRITYKKREVV